MLTIEHNPTHIETAFSGGDSPGTEIRLDGVTRKKNRKNDGSAGVFAKLLAGLVNKKTNVKPGTLISPETAVSAGSAGDRTGKTAFLQLTEAEKKSFKKPKESDTQFLSSKKESKQQKETIQGQNRDQKRDELVPLIPLNPGFSRIFPEAENTLRETQRFSSQPVSFKSESPEQVKNIMERRLPFRNREMPETTLQGEIRNITMQFKKEEKPSGPGDRFEDKAETKKSGRKRSLEVFDLRTQTGAETGTIVERGLKATEEIRNSPVKEITLDLRPTEEQAKEPAGAGVQKTPAGENFEQILARELQGDLSADIVKQAAVVLRDGGEGTIKLSLKPESLGKVKIHLEMAENRISGHIVVESEEALRAFEREIHTLEQSFRDSGFEASLNAALDYRNGGQQWKEKEVQPYFSERFAASYEESGAVEFSGGESSGYGISTVNVLI
ncbi:MAG: flagellar hook-length control protein FliK [Treponema sp.]|nr:flagellar hook-length control protein FliK [Treponema sp.]